MAFNYDEGMPDGLTFKSEKQQSRVKQSAANDTIKSFLQISQTIGKSDQSLQDSISNLVEEQKKLYKRFQEEQQQRQLDAEILKNKGASDQEILSYLEKRAEVYGKETENLWKSFDDLKSTMTRWVDGSEEIDADTRLSLRKQLETFEKLYDLDELSKREEKRKVSFLEQIAGSTKESLKLSLETGKESRRDLLGTLGATLLGPMRLLVDPISSVLTGMDSKELIKHGLGTWEASREKRKEQDEENKALEREQRENQLAEFLQQPVSTKVEERHFETIQNTPSISSLPQPSLPGIELEQDGSTENSHNDYNVTPSTADIFSTPGVSEENPLFEKVTPSTADLLNSGGLIGAAAVYLARQLGKGAKGEDEEEEPGGLLGDTVKKLVPSLASAAGVAAVAAVPLAMLAGGAALQKRDAEDAKRHWDEGNKARAAETLWLGDRDRLTEENANAELGRATGKTALLAGGAVGAGALALGGASAGLAAGGAAAAGGAGLLGTGLAAAGATAAAVLPPVLIGTAIAGAVTAVAKGTQEAFELGWDKKQGEIQKELTDTILSDDSSAWDKVKAGVSSGWKEFTGSMAGGVRGFTEELQKDALLETDKNLTGYLKTGARALAAGVKNSTKVLMEARSGRKGAALDKQALDRMDEEMEKDPNMKSRLTSSNKYQEAINSGKDEQQALKEAYLQEKHEENARLGIQKENGVSVGLQDYAFTYFQKRKDDTSYRQTHEYAQEKAKLMQEGLSSEEADLEAIKQYNEMYDKAMEYRLKQTDDYRDTYRSLLEQGKTAEEAEKEALEVAAANSKNSLTVVEKVSNFFGEVGDSVNNEVKKIKNTKFAKSVGSFASRIWGAVSDWFGKIGRWFSDKWEGVTDAVSGGWDGLKTATGNIWDKTKSLASDAMDFVRGKKPDSSIEDGIVTKEGKVIELSPDDNVYATKNMPTVVGDTDAQRAMPLIPREQAEFTDKNIVAAIETLIRVLEQKNFSPSFSINGVGAEATIDYSKFQSA